MTTAFDALLGKIKNSYDPSLISVLQDLAAGNYDRDMVAKALSVISITYANSYWKDELMTLAGVNPVGPATAPTADPDGEGWLFDGGSIDNVAVLSKQINHDCKQGSISIVPHIHWRKTSAAAGNVVWRLEYKYADTGGSFGNYVQLGTDQKTPVSGTVDNNTATRHLITSFGALTLPVGLSTIIVFKLSRIASDTVNDTYAANALAMSFDYHYPVDSPGSAGEYSKN